jgi:hypothetical protein
MLFMALSILVSSQTFVVEDFSGGTMPPTGWTIDAHAANWTADASTYAEGTAPEATFNWSPDFVGSSRLISPAVDLTGLTTVKLVFKHFLDDYDGLGGYTLSIATRSGGGPWNIAWTVSPLNNIGPEELVLDIANSDVGSSSFQFCFFFDGDSYNLDYWYIDDVLLFVPYEVDGAMTSINMPSYIAGPVPVEGVFRNLGTESITSVEVSWQVSEEMTYITTFTGLSLDLLDSYNFSCDDPFYFPLGDYSLDVWISAVNGTPDDNPANDLTSKQLHVVSHTVYRKPCFEEFTSSTCSPCAGFNEDFNPWTEVHADEITLIKYQMDWPGNGDPYYTEEGGNRRMYYGVSYVPWPQCNGAYVDYTIGAVEAAFEDAILQPGIAKIASSHTMVGTEITVNANLLPFANFTDVVAHIVVVENTTVENTGGNGETAFHHVMMKMLPDAYGTELTLDDREPVTLTETFDLENTFIEEFDDLSVVIIFQDFYSKEIFQSEYSIEDGVFASEASCAGITYDGMPVPGFSPDVFDYEIELPVGTTEVPMVAGTAEDPNATLIVVPTWELPGTTVVDVFGEDLVTRLTYNIHFSVEVGVDEPGNVPVINLYPNPVRNTLNVNGAKRADLKIFTITGQLVMSISGFNDQSIDISGLENGVYTVQVVLENNAAVNKKITILR